MKRHANEAITPERGVKKSRHLEHTPPGDVVDLTQNGGMTDENDEDTTNCRMLEGATTHIAVEDAATLRQEQDHEYRQALLIDQCNLQRQEQLQRAQHVTHIAAASSVSSAARVQESRVAPDPSSSVLPAPTHHTTPDVITVLAEVACARVVPANQLVTFSFRSRTTAWAVSFDARTTRCCEVYEAVREAFKISPAVALRLRASQPPRELQDAVLPTHSSQTLAQWLPSGSARRMRWFIETN